MSQKLVQKSRLNFGELPDNPDVELICSDGRILVHRVLLAATSRWMKEIFTVSHTDEQIQTVLLQDIQTCQISPTIDFLYGRSDILTRDELNKDLLFDVFNSSFPFCSVNVIVKTENEEKKINIDTTPYFDDMIQVEIKEEKDDTYEDNKDILYNMIMDQQNFAMNYYNQIIDDFKPPRKRKRIKNNNVNENGNSEVDLEINDVLKSPDKRNREKKLCDKCDKEFANLDSLNKHIKFIHEGVKLKCELCSYESTKPYNLKIHRQRMHEEKVICDRCEKEFSNVYSLNKHIKFIHEGIKSKCDLCDYESAKPYDMKIHKQRIHEGQEYPCDQCEYKSKSKHHLKYHIKTQHEGFRLQCDQCDFRCVDHSGLRSHRQTMHENIKYPCKECSYVGSNPKNLYTHQKRCHMEKQLLCDECDLAFSTESALKEHKAIQHEGIRFKCNICDYSCKHRSTLKYHRKVKHSDSKIPCDVCDFMAWNDNHLKRHKLSEHGINVSYIL